MGYSIQSAALLLLLAAAVSEALSSPKDYRQKWNLTRQDVVIAMPVDKNHLTLAKGSRVWRKVRGWCSMLMQSCIRNSVH